jgi:apolipoprotein N-acyltransferase
LRNPDAWAVIDRAARAISVPILVGAVLGTGDGHTTNTAIVWSPRTGPGQRHDKRPMPFAEYIPYRDFFRLFSPYVDRAGDFVPGNGDSAVDLGPARVGVAICSEVMFDDLVRQGVRSGAQLLAVPTNNATFGFTEMTYQQQAISRVRAVEHGRTVLVATRLGPAPEWVLVALGLLGVVAALVVQSRAKAGSGGDPLPPKEDVDGGSTGRRGRRRRRPDDRGDPDLRREGQPADGPAPVARGGT